MWCANGYDAERNTFTQSYGSPHLDAALLLIPRVGFLAPDDPRVAGTVDAVQRDLQRDGLVYRYHQAGDARADGLPGSEGAFLACSFWLVDALGNTPQAFSLVGLVNSARLLSGSTTRTTEDQG